jgi:hypothetical protein
MLSNIKLNSQKTYVQDLLEMLELKELKCENVNPKWTTKQQSDFMESVFLNMPTCPIWAEEHADNTRTIIDGFERITAIKNFVEGKFELQGLEFYKDLEGLKYEGLTREKQRTIGNLYFDLNTIQKGTPAEAKEILKNRIKR